MEPFYEEGGRTILKVKKIFKKTKDGDLVDLDRQAVIVSTTSTDLKKGDVVYYNPRGCVNLETRETKKEVFLVVDNVDIYAKL